jgi:hypothetical protein
MATPKSILTNIPGPGQFEDAFLTGVGLSSAERGDTTYGDSPGDGGDVMAIFLVNGCVCPSYTK